MQQSAAIVLNKQAKVECQIIGSEQTPLLIIDDLLNDSHWLQQQALAGDYQADPANFYPGIRCQTPALYQQALSVLLPLLQRVYAPKAQQLRLLTSAFSLASTPAEQLKPIQMLPHFDTVEPLQLAMVHYLCDASHGGTAFYRHQSTGFERIDAARLPSYATLLKQQAMAARLHENPSYMSGDTELFQQIAKVEARVNRAIIYPGNLLHSGDIRQIGANAADPAHGRLTISSFLQLI
jgi:hypothetical protein